MTRAMVIPIETTVTEIEVVLTVITLSQALGEKAGPFGTPETTFRGSPEYVRGALSVFFAALIDGKYPEEVRA